jgi:uncharacterized protein YegP (UPF0339 family)
MSDNVDFYRDAAGDWRWRRTAPNHETVATSSEGYRRRNDAEDNARRINGDNVTYTNNQPDDAA